MRIFRSVVMVPCFALLLAVAALSETVPASEAAKHVGEREKRVADRGEGPVDQDDIRHGLIFECRAFHDVHPKFTAPLRRGERTQAPFKRMTEIDAERRGERKCREPEKDDQCDGKRHR